MKTLKILMSSLLIGSLFGFAACAEPLSVGDAAPSVAVTMDTGDTVDLTDIYGTGPVLVYFYPKSFTGGCTKQACNLRDNFPDITEIGITVVGVSGDDVETQARFREEYNLPFHLVADTEGALANAFGVPVRNGNVASRQSFLVDGGTVVWLDLKANPVTQAEDALEAFASLNN